jgi:preprotein translocase subunit SecG
MRIAAAVIMQRGNAAILTRNTIIAIFLFQSVNYI